MCVSVYIFHSFPTDLIVHYYYILQYMVILLSVSSVTQSCLTLCDPMNRSTPGLPVHHQLPGFTQTHVHRVGDAIQLSHPNQNYNETSLTLVRMAIINITIKKQMLERVWRGGNLPTLLVGM